MIVCRLAPAGWRSKAITRAVLPFSRTAGRAWWLACFFALPFLVATLRRAALPVGCSCRMAFQIRFTATCRLVNRSTGSTPGRLFQISTSLAPGQSLASAASSSAPLKVSVPAPLPSISFKEEKTVMFCSVSMLNVGKIGRAHV